MRRRAPAERLLLFAGALVLAGCAAIPAALQPQAAQGDATVAATIDEATRAALDAWNRGDLTAFLAPYDVDVVVVHPSGPEQGIDLLAARVSRDARWNGARPEVSASLERHEVRLIDEDHALQVALVVLQRDGTVTVRRWLSAVWQRTSNGWRVIHHHSH